MEWTHLERILSNFIIGLVFSGTGHRLINDIMCVQARWDFIDSREVSNVSAK